MKNTTLCHIEQDGKYLMLHRTKKKNDLNQDKWVGIGGKFEHGESPEDCVRRETTEETGLPFMFWDERLSSSAVETFLIKEVDLSRAKRKKVLDASAATYILQGALDRLSRM